MKEKFLLLVNTQLLPYKIHLHSLGRVLATNQVVDNVGVTDTLFDGLGVAQIVFLWESDIVRHSSIFETGKPIQ